MDEFCDGLGGKVNRGDFFRDDAGDNFFAEGNEDDVAGLERDFRGISEGAAAGAVNFGRDDLIKHRIIIARLWYN